MTDKTTTEFEQMPSKVDAALEITKEWANPDYGWTKDEHTIFHAIRQLKNELSRLRSELDRRAGGEANSSNVRDWKEDADEENGNYSNKCAGYGYSD